MSISQPPGYPLQLSGPNDDEISLGGILEILQRRWKTVAAFALGIPLLALSVGLVWPKQYEAIALIQVARVGNFPAASSIDGVASSAVESSTAVIQRLQSSAFQARLNRQLQTPASIKAIEPKKTGLMTLVARAPTQAGAEAAASLALDLLTEVHAELARRPLDSLNRSLEIARQEASQSTALLMELLVEANKIVKVNPELALMLGQLRGQLLFQQSVVKERQLRLELALSPPNTIQTHAVEDIVSSNSPVEPQLRSVVMLGLVGGGLLGVLIALMQQAWQNRRAAAKST